ncbi:MAG: sialidase family protein [Pirellulales bacterium]
MNRLRSLLLSSIFPLSLATVCFSAEKVEQAEDPAAAPPPINSTPGPEYADDVRMFQGIPSLERAPNGRLWAMWYGGGVTEDRHNYVMLVTSGDDGQTWSGLKLVIDPDRDGPVRAFDPCLWLDPAGRLWLFWAQQGGGLPYLHALTTDHANDATPTWSKARLICKGIMMCKPTVTRDGAWLLPTAIWQREGSCRVVASTDRGKTWSLRGTATIPDRNDRNCDEPMIIERSDGSLWMWVRTRYGIGESASTDGGRTWSDIVPSKVAHPVARFFLRRLVSGNFLLVKHGPIDVRTGRSHLTAYVSKDDGRTWLGGLLLDQRTGVSYPDGFQGTDGRIYVIRDYDRLGDKEILMSVFTEADVLAGKDVSGKTRLRVLINKATGEKPDHRVKTPKT